MRRFGWAAAAKLIALGSAAAYKNETDGEKARVDGAGAEQSSTLRGPEEVVLARLGFAALPVVLQAVARCSWFTSCLRLSDMPIPTPIAHVPPQSTRFWRFLRFLALRGPRHQNGSLSGPVGMVSAPAGCS